VHHEWIIFLVIYVSKALSTLSQKSETVAENGDCRQIQRQSHLCATVTLLCDSLTFLRQCGQGLICQNTTRCY